MHISLIKQNQPGKNQYKKKTLASLMLKIYRKVYIIHARTIRSSEQMHMSLTGIVSLDNNFLFANLL